MEKQQENRKIFRLLDKLTISFEIVIAFLLLIVIAIKFLDMIFEFSGLEIVILSMDFQQIFSTMLNLVIGVEFVRMLYKHSPVSIIYVLLFAIARHIILYNEGIVHLLVGVVSIAGLFAVNKYFIGESLNENDDKQK